MIARFQVLIPFLLFVEADLAQQVNPEEVTVGGLRALIYPPHRSRLQIGDVSGESQVAASDVSRRLDPADPQPHAPNAQMDNRPVIVGDVLRIDLYADQFNRTIGAADDPVLNLAFNLANSWLQRFRTLNRIFWAKPFEKHHVPWKLEVLHDDGAHLAKEDGKWRYRLGSVTIFKQTGLDASVWNAIGSLSSSYEPEPSDELLLDAYGLLPQIGPALVLAHTAVETRAARTLDRLALLTGLNPRLWSWMTNRGDFTKDPSTAEQLDVLTKALTGKSLKENQSLWEGFQHLRQARNRFVHEGKATIGSSRIPVDSDKATQLVQAAEAIIAWLEDLLPQAERRPRFQSSSQLTVTKLFIAPIEEEIVADDALPDATSGEENESQYL